MKKLFTLILITTMFILGINQTTYALQYNVTFYTWDNQEIDSYASDEALEIIVNLPSRTGYTALGWFDEDDIEWRENDQMLGDLVLYATYEINEYTITFNSNGGSAVSPITQDYGTNVSAPNNPVKAYYTFDGWYSDSGLNNAYIFSTMGASNITLYAKWELITYTVTFYTWDENYISDYEQSNLTGFITEETADSRTGYTFIGWYDSGSSWWQDGDQLLGDLDVYATYEINEYTITFNSNGGSAVSPFTQDYGSVIGAPISPTKQGYTFVGWYSDVGLTTPYTFTTMGASNITLYAKWQLYRVSFYTWDDTLIVTSEVGVTFDDGDALPTPSRTGYTFVDWVDGDDTIWRNGDQVTGDLDVYAYYEANEYTITFNSNGGSSVSAITQDYGTSVSAPTPPTLELYYFMGWYSDDDLTIPYIFDTMGLSITLYAKWGLIVNDITFQTWDDNLIVVKEVGVSFDDTGVTKPSRTGYTFVDWKDISNGIWRNGDQLEGDLTVYAFYSANQYTITFNSNGGSLRQPITQDYGTNVSAPSNPNKQGYSFDGWYSDVALTTPYTFTTMGATNITLYAKWNLIGFTVTFYTHDSQLIYTSTQSNINGLITSVATAPSRTYYTFIGWYDSGSSWWQDGDQLLGDLDLYATYSAIQYTISFNSNGGSFVTPITQGYGTNVNAPSDPSKQGFSFGGWYSDVGLTTSYTFTTMGASNITLYAKWNLITFDVSFYTFDSVLINLFSQSNVTGLDTSVVTPPIRLYYGFIGWYDSGSSWWQDGDQLTGDLILFAKYEQFDYNVIVNTDTLTPPVNYPVLSGTTFNNSYPNFIPPTKYGYFISNWYTGRNYNIHLIMPELANTSLNDVFTTKEDLTHLLPDNRLEGDVTYDVDGNITEILGNTVDVNGTLTHVENSQFKSVGKNLFDKGSVEYGKTINADTGVIGTNLGYVTPYIRVLPNTAYYSFGFGTTYANFTSFYDVNKNYISRTSGGFSNTRSYTTPTDAHYAVINQYGFTTAQQVIEHIASVSIQLELGTVATTYAPYNSETQKFNHSRLSKLPNAVSDKIRLLNGAYVLDRYVKELTLTSGMITNIDNATNAQWVRFTKPLDFVLYNNSTTSLAKAQTIIIEGFVAGGAYTLGLAGTHTNYYPLQYSVAVPLGTYASLAEAQADLAGTKIWYQLATPLLATEVIDVETTYYRSDEYIAYIPSHKTLTIDEIDDYYLDYQEGLNGFYTTPSLYEIYNFNSVITDDTYLYPMWELDTFTITFNSNGGTSVSPISQLYDTVVNAPLDPSRKGYTFDGWYIDVGFGTEYTFDTMEGMDRTLYAKWNINYYDVTFNSNGGSELLPYEDVMFNTTINKPTNPTRANYNFVGWYKDSKLTKEWQFSKDTIQDDTVLYARWQKDIIDRIDDRFDGTFIGTTFGKVFLSILIIAVLVILFALANLPKMIILLIVALLLMLFIAIGWIPLWIIFALTFIILALLFIVSKGGGNSGD